MTEKDFRQLKDLRTPGEWIDKALLIPERKHKPPFLFRPSVIGAAASLLIIAAAALTLFLNLRQLPEPEPQTVFQTATTAAATAAETVRPSQTAASQPSAAIPQTTAKPQTAATQAPSSSQTAPAVSPSGSSNPSPTPLPTVKPTVSPTVKPTGSPTVTPTAAPTTPATAATQPLTEPTQTPTQTAAQTPTETSPEEAVQTETTDDPQVATSPRKPFYGRVTIRISPKCPLYNNRFLYIAVLDRNGQACNPFTIALKLTDGEMTIYPISYSMYLYKGEDYVLRLNDHNGFERRAWFTPADGNIEININD